MFEKVNCIDCAHFDGCRRTYASSTPGDWAYADFEKNEMYDCSAFMPKTEWVHLPCKAGDTIFLPWEWNGENGIARITVLRVVLAEYESYIETDFDSDDYDYFMKYNCGLFWFEDFGKIVFTIKEEAEKALEKRSRK